MQQQPVDDTEQDHRCRLQPYYIGERATQGSNSPKSSPEHVLAQQHKIGIPSVDACDGKKETGLIKHQEKDI